VIKLGVADKHRIVVSGLVCFIQPNQHVGLPDQRRTGS
jgi:hypothetical protein